MIFMCKVRGPGFCASCYCYPETDHWLAMLLWEQSVHDFRVPTKIMFALNKLTLLNEFLNHRVFRPPPSRIVCVLLGTWGAADYSINECLVILLRCEITTWSRIRRHGEESVWSSRPNWGTVYGTILAIKTSLHVPIQTPACCSCLPPLRVSLKKTSLYSLKTYEWNSLV